MPNSNITEKPLVILLVEDNAAHAELVIRSFEDHQIANKIIHVKDGEEALNYLFRKGKFVDPLVSSMPHVVLLDLRLPRVDGLEVLKEIRSADSLKGLPVVILTTSSGEADIARAYDYHANSYLVKPIDFQQFIELMKQFGYYWLETNYHPYV